MTLGVYSSRSSGSAPVTSFECVRAAGLRERSVNGGLDLNGPPNLEEWMWLVGG